MGGPLLFRKEAMAMPRQERLLQTARIEGPAAVAGRLAGIFPLGGDYPAAGVALGRRKLTTVPPVAGH